MGGRRVWGLAFAVLAAWLSMAAAGAVEYRDITVSVDVLPSIDPTHGYRAAIGRIANADNQDHEVVLSLNSGKVPVSVELQSVTRGVVVSARSEVSVQLLIPGTLSCDFYQSPVTIAGRVNRCRWASGRAARAVARWGVGMALGLRPCSSWSASAGTATRWSGSWHRLICPEAPPVSPRLPFRVPNSCAPSGAWRAGPPVGWPTVPTTG